MRRGINAENKMKKEDGIKVAKLCAKYVNANTCVSKCTTDDQKNAVRKHFEREKQEPEISVKTWIDIRIETRLKSIAYCLPDEGYSMGGETIVQFGKLRGVVDTRQYYAKSCRYRENHGYVRVTLTLDELKNIKCIGGLATYIAPNQRAKVKKCWWYTSKGQKQHFELIKKNGYIFEGFHSITKSGALEGGLRNIEIAKQKEIAAKKYAKALRFQYTYQDSIAAGNCEAGTRAFILRCGLKSDKKYRGSFLLKTANEKSSSSVYYVKRMLNYIANVSK